jgi:uncharacterized protein with von Willebrand factor type A (vWA) domain
MYTQLKAQELNSITAQVSATSKLFWQDYLKANSTLLRVTTDTNIKTLNSFALEVFHRLYYSSTPHWLPEKPEHQWARVLHNQLSESEEFQNLTQQCSGDPLGAAIATQSMITNLLRQLKDASDDQQIDELDTLRAKARQAKMQGNQALFEQLQSQGQAMSQAAQAFAQRLQQNQEMAEDIDQGCGQAELDLEEKRAELEALGISWGTEQGSGQPTPVADKLTLAMKIEQNPSLKRILVLAGHALETAQRKRRQHQVQVGYGELVGITTGNDLAQILPHELARLSDSRRKLSFFRDYLEGQLFQNDLQAPEEQGKGPIVICLDCSGSMVLGNRDLWSKALIVALVKLANEQDRVVSVIRFESVCFEPIEIKPKASTDALLTLLAASPTDGGTNFQDPLEQARAIIEKEASYSKADIVFLTDGIAPLSLKFIREYSESLEKLKANLFLLEIEPGAPSVLRELASQVWEIDANQDFEDLGVIFTAC